MGREKLLEVTGYIIRSDRVTSLEPSTRSAVFVGFCHNFYGDEEKTCHWRKKKCTEKGGLQSQGPAGQSRQPWVSLWVRGAPTAPEEAPTQLQPS